MEKYFGYINQIISVTMYTYGKYVLIKCFYGAFEAKFPECLPDFADAANKYDFDQTATTADNKVVDQIAQIRLLICDFNVHMVFSKKCLLQTFNGSTANQAYRYECVIEIHGCLIYKKNPYGVKCILSSK